MAREERVDVATELLQPRAGDEVVRADRGREPHQRTVGPAGEDAVGELVEHLVDTAEESGPAVGAVVEVDQPAFAVLLDHQLVDAQARRPGHLDDVAAGDPPAGGRVADPGRVLGLAAPLGAVVADVEPDQAAGRTHVHALHVLAGVQHLRDLVLHRDIAALPAGDLVGQRAQRARIDHGRRAQLERPGESAGSEQQEQGDPAREPLAIHRAKLPRGEVAGNVR